jgi:hypothetical protein
VVGEAGKEYLTVNRFRQIAWSIFGLIALSGIFQLASQLRAQAPYPNLFVPVNLLLIFMTLLVSALMAGLIITRQPQNPIGWLLFLPALVGSIPADLYLQSFSSAPAHPTILLILAAWYSNWSWLPMIFTVLFIPVLFPTGRPLTPRWRWVIVLGLAMAAFFLFVTTFTRRLSVSDQGVTWTIANPIGFIPDIFQYIMVPWMLGLISLTVLSLASIFVRYRRAQAVERQQIKWLFYACGLFAAVYFVGFPISDLQGLVNDIWTTFLFVAILAFPLAIAIAILRYRLWEIDLIIRRTLQYSLLTGLLVLVYFGSVVLGQRLAGALTGEPDAPLVLVVSTLLIAALFNPLRSRIQDFIDRRFYRRKYDAMQTLAAFTQTARDETQLERLAPALLGAVQDSVQPEQAWLWLKKEH